MTSTNILTFDQGITLLIESGLFLVFYYIYHMVFDKTLPFTSVIVTSILFSLWLFSVTISSNLTLALNIPLSKTSSDSLQHT